MIVKHAAVVLALVFLASCGTTPPKQPTPAPESAPKAEPDPEPAPEPTPAPESAPQDAPAPVREKEPEPEPAPEPERDPAEDVEAPAPAAAESDCDEERLSKISADIRESCSNSLSISSGFPLVKGEPTKEKIEASIFIAVLVNDLLVEGAKLPKANWKAAMNDVLMEMKEHMRQRSLYTKEPSEAPYTVTLGVSPRVSMKRLGEVLSVLYEHDFDVVQFLFDAGPVQIKSLDPVVVREFKKLVSESSPMVRQEKMAKYVSKAIGTCLPMKDALQSLAMASPDMRCEVMAKGVPDALRDCQCKADIDRIVAPMVLTGGNKIGLAKVTFGEGAEVKVRARETWSQAAPRFKKLSGQTVAPFW